MKKTLIILFILLFLAIDINYWQPWQRQPVVFYEPVFLPIETIKGDIIVLENGTHLVIDEDKRINSIEYNNDDSVTINSTVHCSLWQLMQARIEALIEIVRDYFNLNFGEFARKYDVSKGRLPGDEIFEVLKATNLKGERNG